MLATLEDNFNVGNTLQMREYPGQCGIDGMFVVVDRQNMAAIQQIS